MASGKRQQLIFLAATITDSLKAVTLVASIRGLDADWAKMRARIGGLRIQSALRIGIAARPRVQYETAGWRPVCGRGLARIGFGKRDRGLKAPIGADWALSAMVVVRIGACGLNVWIEATAAAPPWGYQR